MCWCHFVICYYFITLRVCTGERGFWFCLSILGPPLCFVRWSRDRTAATGSPEQAFQQLCLWKRMLQVEQDNRMPSSMFCLLKEYHFFVLFCFFKKTKKRERKTLLTSCPFQKMGFWETGQIGLVAAISIAEVRPQLCQLKIVEVGSGWKERIDVVGSEKYLRRSMSSILEAPYTLKDGT